jgi:hypothetical protein
MKFKGQVIAEDQSTSKKTGQVYNELTLIDLDEGMALKQTVDYSMLDDEAEKLAGSLRGKRVEINVKEIRPGFGNQIRFRGALVMVDGKPVGK